MTTRRKRITKSAGVTLEVVVLDYLADLAEKEDRNRSFCINRIVRAYAEEHGCPLPSAAEQPSERAMPTSKE